MQAIQALDYHCEGDYGRVILDAAGLVPDPRPAETLTWLNGEGAWLLRYLVQEPRGGPNISVLLMLPPVSPGAIAGFVVLQGDGAHPMSGSNCMGFVTALIDSGHLKVADGVHRLSVDTAAGPVGVTATVAHGHCTGVSLALPSAFAVLLDATLDVPDVGRITCDIAFGGAYYAQVDAAQLGIDLVPENTRRLVGIGSAIGRAAQAQFQVQHPILAALNKIDHVMFRSHPPGRPGDFLNCTTGGARCDRSPCGTGTAARVATTAARGLLQPGARLTSYSVIGSTFAVDYVRAGRVGPHDSVECTVTGRAWLVGRYEYLRHPTDPYPEGFQLADLWQA